MCTGCQSIGPKAIEQSHPLYNDAVISAVDRQLLTNIVRLKYRDNPMFLEVSGVADSRNIGCDVGLKAIELFPKQSTSTKIAPTFLLKNYQQPTISYRPLQGKEFIKHMLTPIPLNVLLGMSTSGWKLQRVFNACVEKMNDIENAPTASGPMPWNRPNYEKFYALTNVLRQLEDAGAIVVGVDPENNKHLIFHIKENFTSSKAVAEFRKILNLNPNKDDFRLEANFLKASKDDIVIRTRSLMGVLFYLSHAVEVPTEDVERGIVQTTVNEDGSVFDWSSNASGTLLKVHCSKTRPENAFVSTYYRGTWFFIDDNDLHSKSTFMFISMLFNLQAGEATSADVAPMLTIPVGR
jgi:hypothetical protein